MSISFLLVLVGIPLLVSGVGLSVAGIILFARRTKVVGTIVALVGLALIAAPVLTLLYLIALLQVM